MADPILARVRKRLGFRPLEVATAGGWSRREFAEIERNDDPDLETGQALEDLYGVDLAGILEAGKVTIADVPVGALLKGNSDVLSADARFSMTAALSVARDIREVEEVLGFEPALSLTRFRENKDLRHPEQGGVEPLAEDLRRRLKLADVIPSMVRDVCDPLGILIFAAPFRDTAIDALSTWSPATGPVILLNSDSPGIRGEYGLRTALAHESCHLLFDRKKMRRIHSFCQLDAPTPKNQSKEEEAWLIERRARAFQVELLAPKSLLIKRWSCSDHPSIQALSREFGLGPRAVAWQLNNAGGPSYDGEALPPVVDHGWPEHQQISPQPVEGVHPFRSGRLLKLVRKGVRSGQLSGSWARELLRIDVPRWDRLYEEWMS